jgi:hypothetical protein
MKERCISESKVVTCRSSWEIILITKFLDKHPDIISWDSESIVIPYKCPVRNYSLHRYFVDFWVKFRDKNGRIFELLIEVKPEAERMLAEHPTAPKKMTKSAIDRIQTAIKNKAKWDATRAWCSEEQKKGRNIQFVIWTEKNSPVPFI